MFNETPVAALLVAAGSGVRSGHPVPKQYARLAGRPVLAHAVDALRRHPSIDRIQLVIGEGQQALAAEALGEAALPPPVIGAADRMGSVAAGIAALAELPDHAIVLVHDAARPFLPPAVVDRLLAALDLADGALPVLPVVDTLARADAVLGDSVERTGLVRVQTPQAFRLGALRRAHASWAGDAASDDAQMVRAAGFTVVPVPGDPLLEKLTHAEDFTRAEARLMAALTSRTGMGFDVHAFCLGDHVWIGGIRIDHDHGLAGHSDADVALHALTDAVLGAIGDGDIGVHFPPSDPRWKGAASSQFLEHARDLVLARGGVIDHVDVTVICEAPRMGPHRDPIRRHIAGLLRLATDQVSVKATTTERLGFTGRGEGIAAQAIATVRLRNSE